MGWVKISSESWKKKAKPLEQAPTGAEDVEILRVVGAYRHIGTTNELDSSHPQFVKPW